MRVSLKWLSEYTDLLLPADELARRLTLSTAEVEAIERIGGDWDNVCVARVLEVTPHPNADRLRLATVDAGSGARTVVCGAPNLAVGQKVAFAEVGAHLIDGHSGRPTVLKASVIRGVESAGMVCSEKELGLSGEHEGILVLPEDAPVGTPLGAYLGDTVLDLYSWPHRPDLMSMIGVAREVAALTGSPLREPPHGFPVTGVAASDGIAVDIDAPDLCSRYIAVVVEGVQLGPSPSWMQERLTAAGMRPINNVVDITNYVMLEIGQPLHAFDYDRIADHHIIVRRAREGERLRTLDGEDRTLDPRMLVIADPAGPVALAGVMGGESSEVGAATRLILLEAACFDSITVRAASTRLRLRSEASARFEKAIGPEVARLGAERAVQLFVELCGGTMAGSPADVHPGARPAPVVSVAPDRIRAVLGAPIDPAMVHSSLASLGFAVEGGSPADYRVSVPYWRTDVSIADDVIEEVIRIVGYETIPQTSISGPVPEALPEPIYELRGRIQDLLVASGMQEVITYSLVSEDMLPEAGEPAPDSPQPLRIVQPASQDHVFLRPSLRASLLRTLAMNLRQRRGELAIFETARVYRPRADDLPEEPELATGMLTGLRLDRWGMPGAEAVDFYDARGIVEAVLRALRVDAAFRPAERAGLVSGRCAEVVANEQILGVVGQIHPTEAQRFDIEQEVYVFELSLEALLPVLNTTPAYQPYSRFPAVVRDLAVVVDDSVEAGAVGRVIRRGRFVTEVRPFDVYAGPPIAAGRKSIAFSVQYQEDDRTLTEEEVARSLSRTLQQLNREFGAELRDGGG